MCVFCVFLLVPPLWGGLPSAAVGTLFLVPPARADRLFGCSGDRLPARTNQALFLYGETSPAAGDSNAQYGKICCW